MGKLILSETLTKKISKDLNEEVISADFVASSKPKGDYKNFCYIVNSKWQVIVYFNINNNEETYWNIQNLAEIEKKSKEYEERITRVAIKAGVPLNIVMLVGCVENEERVVELFKHIKSCRGIGNEILKDELKNSNNYVVESAIIKIIGEEAWKSVNRNRNMAISALSVYFSE